MTVSHDRALAALLAFAELASPYLADRRASDLAEALDRFCLETLTTELAAVDNTGHLESCRRTITPAMVDAWSQRLDELRAAGISPLLVCADDYPTNLRMVFDRPPLLFTRGAVTDADQRAVAVVGTRTPTEEGYEMARELAGAFARCAITVVSGMAQGIDTAAHTGALTAGGRTVAVLGQGVSAPLSGERRKLAREIVESGAVVSQFWPRQPATRWTFPVRNRVTSGLSLATIVVEAGPTSGAKLQTEDALRHGKRVFLVERLVTQQQWAADLAGHPSVSILTDVQQIIDAVEIDLDTAEGVLV